MPSTAAVMNSPSLFSMGDAVAVRRHLNRHPALVPLLIEARRAIPRFFPDTTRVRLDLLTDRDGGDHVDLFAIIQTALPEDQALELLDGFEEEWWLKVAAQGCGQLTFDVETRHCKSRTDTGIS
jgi:hypothetical protein